MYQRWDAKVKTSLKLVSAAILASISATSVANQEPDNIEVITVTGDFKKESIQTLSASVHVLGEQDIAMRNAVHLDEMLNTAANVNYTSGASRGRFIQIRGIGLRSQFVDPINPSVGLLIDGINYSGLGGAALLFDTQQAEIYRGPQGTRFGADALAGMIHIDTNEATTDARAKLQLGAGNYNSYNLGIAAGGGIDDVVGMRASVYQNSSDGYVDNIYLNESTQDQDELVARFKAKTDFSDVFVSELNLHYIDIENGYDAFTLDNSRKSVADQPGQDNQESYGVSWRNNFSGFDSFDINFNVNALNADLLYSYDEDWVCNDPEEAELCSAGLHSWGYSSTDAFDRERKDRSVELNVQSKEGTWIGGVYYQSKEVDLTRAYTWQAQDFESNYQVDNIAVFGQLETRIDDRTVLITGVRAENYQGDYLDNNGFSESVDDSMVGGKLALEHQVNQQAMIYTSLTSGYKVGGINGEALAKARDEGVDQSFFETIKYFDPEYLWSGEFGVKGMSKDKRLVLRLAAFYMYRDNMQVKAYKEYKANEASEPVFVGYFDNAASGRNYGIEIDGRYQLTDRISLNGAVGYLRTRMDDFVNADGESKDGREQAQAPRYNYAFSARFDATENLYVNLGIEGKDDYYFSDSHDSRAESVNLVNAKIGYSRNAWELSAWVRNMFNQDYATRGFEFGNDPRDFYETHTYVQFAEPRMAGVSFTYQY
ncbi:TonB-dependent receptor [Pseudoalteromonas spongiae]|uniref:TonB-dependent receptor n=1 Tax=Pseudoalteromonas spongiae TaxID=298657 RepID=UPI003734CB85